MDDVKGTAYIMTGKELLDLLSDEPEDTLKDCLLQCQFVCPDTKLPVGAPSGALISSGALNISSGAREMLAEG